MAQTSHTLSAPYIARLPGESIWAHLAQEEALLNALPVDGIALLLWVNAPCVVIGRNQNAYAQCDLDRMRDMRIRLARRQSGGGAVYHDCGNLCFSFLSYNPDSTAHFSYVLRALDILGIHAHVSGNDIEAHGRKISGSAFFRIGNRCLHHGTLLIDTDLSVLGTILRPSLSKLASRGIESVRARVENLSRIAPGISIDAMCDALTQSFTELYPGSICHSRDIQLPREAETLETRYASHAWLYGEALPFTALLECRLPCGTFAIDADIRAGRITNCRVDTDAADAGRAAQVARSLEGIEFIRESVEATITRVMSTGATG